MDGTNDLGPNEIAEAACDGLTPEQYKARRRDRGDAREVAGYWTFN